MHFSLKFPCESLPDLQRSGAGLSRRLLPGLQPPQHPDDSLLCHHDVLLQGQYHDHSPESVTSFSHFTFHEYVKSVTFYVIPGFLWTDSS